MGNCFSSGITNRVAISSETEEKTKEEGNPINNMHTLLESFKYPMDRQPTFTFDVDL